MNNQVIGLYNYNSKEENSLSFKKGDLIIVKTRLASGWWDGICSSTGRRGWFPSNYVTSAITSASAHGINNESTMHETRQTTRQETMQHTASETTMQDIHRNEVSIQETTEPMKPIIKRASAASFASSKRSSKIQLPKSDYEADEIKLPTNWGMKSLSNGKVYFFNILTNETKWSLKEIMEGDDLDIDGEPGDIPISNIVYTWGGLQIFVITKIRNLIKDIERNLKEDYLSNTADVIDSIRIMLHVSGTSDLQSSLFKQCPQLYRENALVLNYAAKLIIASKVASTVWPPPDAHDEFLKCAHELLGYIRNFTAEASYLKLKIQEPNDQELSKLQSLAIDADLVLQPRSDAELIERLEEIIVNLMTFVDTIDIQHNPTSPVSISSGNPLSNTEGKIVFTSPLSKPVLISVIKDIVKEIGTYLALVDDIPLESLSEDLTMDFKVNRLTLLNCVTDLVMTTKESVASSESLEASQKILMAVDVVNKAAKELLISTKFLIEEKESVEHDYLKNYIEKFVTLAPPNQVKYERGSQLKYAYESLSRSDFDSPYSGNEAKSSKRTSRVIAGGPESLSIVKQVLPFHTAEQSNDDDKFYLQPEYNQDDIAYNSEGLVKGGTLPALIEKLTNHQGMDEYFLNAFLLTFKSIISSKDFFTKLLDRYTLPAPQGLTNEQLNEWNDIKQTPIRANIVKILKLWIEEHCLDTSDDKITLEMIADFSVSTLKSFSQSNCNEMLKLVQRKKEMQFKPLKTASIQARSKMPPPILPKTLKSFTLFELSPLEVARQITLIESKEYKSIRPAELLSKAWKVTTVEPIKVDQMIQFSIKVSQWVTREILAITNTDKQAKSLEYFISIAQHCRDLNNFSTLMALLASLNSPDIQKLNTSWALVNPNLNSCLKNLNQIKSPQGNFEHYRTLLNDSKPPCVPFIGIYIADLTFINETTSSYLNALPHLVNVTKLALGGDVLLDSQRFCACYSLRVVPEIEAFLQKCLY